MNARAMTPGEKAVGLSHNPSNRQDVYECKKHFDDVIDKLHDITYTTTTSDQYRAIETAIIRAQEAQMWAVRAITWQD